MSENQLPLSFSVLQPILESMSHIGNVWLKFIDPTGKYIATTQNREQCEFCSYIRSNYRGERRCRASARQAVFGARSNSQPYFSQCHAGLTILSVPVSIGGLHFGSFAFGEIKESPTPYVLQRISGLNLNRKKLIEFYKEIPVLSQGQISMLAETLHNISNGFIEIGASFANKKQNELTTNELPNPIAPQAIDPGSTNVADISFDIPPLMVRMIVDAEQYIISNFSKSIGLRDVANNIYVNPAYLSYLFRKVTGRTFKSYLTNLRIQKAKELLRHSLLTVSEISLLVGYNDSNYFSRAFKKATGLPPSSYRE